MALVENWYGTSGVSSEDDTFSLSLQSKAVRKGYLVKPTLTFANPSGRTVKIAIGLACLACAGMLVTTAGQFAMSWLLISVGIYLACCGVFWVAMSLRPTLEVQVDRKNRVFHLIRRTMHGIECRRQIVRFEEVLKIAIVDTPNGFDMLARKMRWNIGRIDMTWRKSLVSPVIEGDLAELEQLLKRLRREIGMA